MVRAALSYFGLIFMLGMVLGTIRTLWLTPAIGATNAVLIELPIMLLASTYAARWIVIRRDLREHEAIRMGLLAFLLLMGAEGMLAKTLVGQDLSEWAVELVRSPGWIGLAGQIIFGVLPWLAVRLNGSFGSRSQALMKQMQDTS